MEPVLVGLETKEVPSGRIRTAGSHTGPSAEMAEQSLRNKPVAVVFAVEVVVAEVAEVVAAEVAAEVEVEVEVEVVAAG